MCVCVCVCEREREREREIRTRRRTTFNSRFFSPSPLFNRIYSKPATASIAHGLSSVGRSCLPSVHNDAKNRATFHPSFFLWLRPSIVYPGVVVAAVCPQQNCLYSCTMYDHTSTRFLTTGSTLGIYQFKQAILTD